MLIPVETKYDEEMDDMEQEYGSLQNMMYFGSKALTPEVGMGATHVMWTDRNAYTVIAVSPSGKRCTVQRDNAVRIDNNGMSDSQQYKYEKDPNGYTENLSLRKDGKWRRVGDSNGTIFLIGKREEYYDYSF